MLSATTTDSSPISWGQALIATGVLAAVALLAGLIVIYGQSVTKAQPTDQSPQGGDQDFIRSWIAIVLVIGLIAFCAFAFAINDTSLRSTLIGGLIASVGSALAFYFSSKAADKARQDIVHASRAAASGTNLVPDLTGMTVDEAKHTLGMTSFSLVVASSAGTVVESQDPAASSSAPRGSSIIVTLA